MLRLAVLALMGAVSAVGTAEAVVSLDRTRQAPELRMALAQVEPAGAQSAAIAKAHDGHYWADADVNGRSVRLLVDTGASAVALTPADARKLGIATDQLTYTQSVITASGRTRAAPVRLGRIAIGGAEVRDVDAVVVENGLATSLLGMTYLGRLSRFEATPTTLVLRS